MMKAYSFLVICLLCLFSLNAYSQTQSDINNLDKSINIPVFGKGGAIYQNGHYRLCPDFAFRRCATITVTLRDIWNYFFGINPNTPFGVDIELYDDNESVFETLRLMGKMLNNISFATEDGLQNILEDDIILY